MADATAPVQAGQQVDAAGEGQQQVQDAATTPQTSAEITTDQAIKQELGKQGSETEQKPTNKFHDRLTKAFPDREFKGDEDYDTAVEEYLSDLENYKEKGTQANQQLIEIFDTNPEIAEMIRDMTKGATFREAAARHLDPSELTPVEGDPDYDAWSKNAEARRAKLENDAKFRESYEANFQESVKEIEGFQKENQLTPDQMNQIFSEFDQIVADITNGKVTKDTLVKIRRAIQYEEAVKDAEKIGETRGKNEKIMAERTKQGENQKGDGLPQPSQKANEIQREEVDPATARFAELVEKANSKRRI